MRSGGWSLSTTTLTRGSRTSVRPFTVPSPVVKITSSSSSTNQTGAACGRPSAAWSRPSRCGSPPSGRTRRSSSVIGVRHAGSLSLHACVQVGEASRREFIALVRLIVSPRFFSLRTSSLNGARSRPSDVGRSPARVPGWAAIGVERGPGPGPRRNCSRVEPGQAAVDVGDVVGGQFVVLGERRCADRARRRDGTRHGSPGATSSPRRSATNAAGDS